MEIISEAVSTRAKILLPVQLGLRTVGVSICKLVFIDPACVVQVRIYSQSFEGLKNPSAQRAARTAAARAQVQEYVSTNRNIFVHVTVGV